VFILFNVSGRLWGGLSLGICSSGGWTFVKLKWSPYFSMYQAGCGEASAWESVLLEAGLSLNLKVHKIEIFFAFDFEICIISLLFMSKY
jgi:hypothetical protein